MGNYVYMLKYSEMRQMVDSLVAEWKIDPVRLRINYRFRSKLGRYSPKKRLIEISSAERNDNEVIETLLHEFAHVLAIDLDKSRGHSLHWKARMRQLGVRKPRARTKVKNPDNYYRYRYDCGLGCIAYGHNRRPKFEGNHICIAHDKPFRREYLGE